MTSSDAEDFVCYNSEDLLCKCCFFLYIIVGPAHYYGNNGHLREKGITLQLCMPENDVAGL
jgi:hypothetical protein